MTQQNIRNILEKHPLIPVVTFQHMEEIDPTMEKLKAKDIHCIEITLRTDISYEAIRYVKQTYGSEFSVGMGTVVLPKHIEMAQELQVDFMVSPGINEQLAKPLSESKIAFIPGVVTPSEIMIGLQHGWDTFKFFPASLFGGTETLKAYAQVFPTLKFCPTGGINETNFSDYAKLSNVICVGGSWMLK